MDTQHEAWLALVVEHALEPSLPICDPHHHLWDRPNDRYLVEQLEQDLGSGHNVVQTVFVECHSKYRAGGPEEMRPVGETEFVERITAPNAGGRAGTARVAAGIVGHADLTLGSAVTAVLEAHVEAGRGRFRGIRHSSAWDAGDDPIIYKIAPQGLLLDPKFREGFACLEKLGLSFDAWLYHPQLTELADLARAFPDVPIVLNHIGSPIVIGPYAAKRQEALDDWKRGMTEVASCPNVALKLGSFGRRATGIDWRKRARPPTSTELAESIAPLCHFCIDAFGADRCMFESNFPVDKVSYSYSVLWNAFKRVAQGFSPDERAALFQKNAARIYRLATDDA
ncbi:MAG: amidohydrolase family protein [Chloroflexi bacterium]|nr:amidohydrolase family protein [Chloroflexota bacterium]